MVKGDQSPSLLAITAFQVRQTCFKVGGEYPSLKNVESLSSNSLQPDHSHDRGEKKPRLDKVRACNRLYVYTISHTEVFQRLFS